jgi:hypothetical protein
LLVLEVDREMIIESAFYQLPEIWVKRSEEPSTERDVVTDFKWVISKQTEGHLIPSIEKEYPINKTSGPKLRADLHVNIRSVARYWESQYIIKPETWMEVKYFRQRIDRSYDIRKDLLRLCVLVKEHQRSGIRDKSRYFCAILSGESEYVPSEQWLESLLSPGVCKNIQIRFDQASPLSADLELALKTITYTFAPLPGTGNLPLYWGYLVRIFGFTLRFVDSDDLLLLYEEPECDWPATQVKAQQEIGEKIIEASLVGESQPQL